MVYGMYVSDVCRLNESNTNAFVVHASSYNNYSIFIYCVRPCIVFEIVFTRTCFYNVSSRCELYLLDVLYAFRLISFLLVGHRRLHCKTVIILRFVKKHTCCGISYPLALDVRGVLDIKNYYYY